MKKLFIILIVAAFALPMASFGQGCMDAGDADGVAVKGFFQPQYEYTNIGDDPSSGFTFNRARIGVVGNIPYDFTYYGVIDFSRFKKDNFILDAFATYTRFKWANISFGQFKNPFGLEQNTACSGLHTIQRSRVVNELAGPIRDMGIMVFGGSDTNLLRYSFAVMNGMGQGVADENNGKDVIGRLVVQPFYFFSIGGSFKYGTHGKDNDDDVTRFGGEMQLKFGEFLFQSEYIWGRNTGTFITGGGCDGGPEIVVEGPVDRHGFFAHAMYQFENGFQPVIKFESFDNNLDETGDIENYTTFGVNYFFNDWTRLQLNYIMGLTDNSATKDDSFVVQLQVKF